MGSKCTNDESSIQRSTSRIGRVQTYWYHFVYHWREDISEFSFHILKGQNRDPVYLSTGNYWVRNYH